jgi:predicted ferric reductase
VGDGGGARRVALRAALAAVVALPLLLALTDFHLEDAPAALVLSTAAGALAVSALVLQPLLAGRGRIGAHRLLGGVALALVLAHVAGLFVVAPDDALFAMSPDGPTRARMALIATIALVAVVALGVGRGRLPISAASWRILHAFLAALVIALGLGHAVLTDGALDGVGTPLLLGLGTLALFAVAAAHVARTRRARIDGRRASRLP